MGLEEAVHARWEATGALTALLPSGRLFTGAVPVELKDDGAAYGSMIREAGSVAVRTSSGTRLDEQRLRLTVVAEQFSTIEEIVSGTKEHFDRTELTWSGGNALNVRVREEGIVHDPIVGRWTSSLLLESLIQTD